jgi:hypothetical protein
MPPQATVNRFARAGGAPLSRVLLLYDTHSTFVDAILSLAACLEVKLTLLCLRSQCLNVSISLISAMLSCTLISACLACTASLLLCWTAHSLFLLSPCHTRHKIRSNPVMLCKRLLVLVRIHETIHVWHFNVCAHTQSQLLCIVCCMGIAGLHMKHECQMTSVRLPRTHFQTPFLHNKRFLFHYWFGPIRSTCDSIGMCKD